MISPRDPIAPAGPVSSETGLPLTARQVYHLDAIEKTGGLLYEAMHAAEGSTPPGEHQEHVFLSRRMAHAATLLETSLMFARKAALETP